MSLDEAVKRRADWRPGVPITLADGQEWHVPRPLLGLFPEVADDGSVRFGDRARFVFGADYDAKVDAYLEAGDGGGEIAALLALAVDLLRRNYHLAGADYRALLPRLFDDEANTAMWRAIAQVAIGQAPKPMPVG